MGETCQKMFASVFTNNLWSLLSCDTLTNLMYLYSAQSQQESHQGTSQCKDLTEYNYIYIYTITIPLKRVLLDFVLDY